MADKDIRYSLSAEDEEPQYYGTYNVYGNDISLQESSPTPHTEPPKDEKQEELNRLFRLLYERDKEFEKAKGKRTNLTILGFAIFYFLLQLSIYNAVIADYHIDQYGNITENQLGIVAIAIMVLIAFLASGFHYMINASIFGHIAIKGREESEILENIKKKIDKLSK